MQSYRVVVPPEPGLRRDVARAYTRWMLRRHLTPAFSVQEQRARLAGQDRMVRTPPEISVRATQRAGVPCLELDHVRAQPGRTLYYIHGGGFIVGSASTMRQMVGHLALRCEARAVLVDYRLAPEHPFPAGIDDCVAVYRQLLEDGVRPSEVAVAGDSAGGCLSALVAQRLRDEGGPTPAALYLISPGTDMTRSGESIRSKAPVDPLLSAPWMDQAIDAYLAGHDPRDPRLSPLFASHADLPPTLIQVGTDEMLLSDAERYAAKSHEAGVEVQLEVWDGLWHDFQLMGLVLPQARRAIARAGDFLAEHLA